MYTRYLALSRTIAPVHRHNNRMFTSASSIRSQKNIEHKDSPINDTDGTSNAPNLSQSKEIDSDNMHEQMEKHYGNKISRKKARSVGFDDGFRDGYKSGFDQGRRDLETIISKHLEDKV